MILLLSMSYTYWLNSCCRKRVQRLPIIACPNDHRTPWWLKNLVTREGGAFCVYSSGSEPRLLSRGLQSQRCVAYFRVQHHACSQEAYSPKDVEHLSSRPFPLSTQTSMHGEWVVNRPALSRAVVPLGGIPGQLYFRFSYQKITVFLCFAGEPTVFAIEHFH